MSGLVQLATRTGRIEQVDPAAEAPVVELHLEPHERVVSLDLRQQPLWKGRKTVDWRLGGDYRGAAVSPTVRIARANFALGQAADLFTRRIRRRHLSVIAVAPASTNGLLPEHFRQLPGLRPYDREAAR